MSVKGRSFIGTGGTRGIGRGLAEGLLREEARVVISGRERKRVDEAVEALERTGGEVIGVAGDVGMDAQAKRLVETALARFGAVDYLINNAGILAKPKYVVETTQKEWEEVLRTNVIGTVNMIRHALPGMEKRKKGVIINLSSGWGRFGEARVASYCASKFAVEGLTQSVALEVAKGVVVIALSPGIIVTDMLRDAFEGEVEGYPTPLEVVPRWLRLFEKIEPSWNGKSLELDRF